MARVGSTSIHLTCNNLSLGATLFQTPKYRSTEFAVLMGDDSGKGRTPFPNLGAETADLKEVKVKLPVEQVLRLHYTRMTKRKNFSDIVSSALTRYFDEFLEP